LPLQHHRQRTKAGSAEPATSVASTSFRRRIVHAADNVTVIRGSSAAEAVGNGELPIPQAERRFRPLARRRAITRTPPTVDIRLRKPWRRLRTSRLG
jgi:hypothetical protein